MTAPFTQPQMLALAANAVAKIDKQGVRGVTLCTMQEIEALAMVTVLSGVLLTPPLTPLQNGEKS